LEKISRQNPLLEAVKISPGRIRKILVQEGKRKPKVAEIIKLAKKSGVPVIFAPQEKLYSADRNHQGVIGFLAARKYVTLESILTSSKLPFLVLLDGVEDPQNLGAIIRTAEAAGADGIILPERRAAGLTSTVASVSSGAVEYVKVAKVKNLARCLDELRKRQIWLVGAEGGQKELWDEFDYTLPVGLVFGSEGKGLRPLVKKKCDKVLALPQFGRLNSLNVAAAAAVFIYEVVKQRIHESK
jgi:23S rRNA (guanosine2251-2'-O)-methyltransferase